MEVLDAECARLRQFTEAALATLMEDSWIIKHLYLWFSVVISLSRLVHQILLCLWEEPVFSLRDRSTWGEKKKAAAIQNLVRLTAFNIDKIYIGECWKRTPEGFFNEETTNLTKSY